MRDAAGQRTDAFHALSTQKLVLEFFSLGDVARHLRRTNHGPVAITNWRDRHGDIDHSTVLSHPRCLEVSHAFTVPDVGEAGGLLTEERNWNDLRNRRSDNLLSCVAENLLRAAIPAGDNTVQRPADDGVVRMFDDARESAGLKLSALPLGDVLHGAIQSDDRTRFTDAGNSAREHVHALTIRLNHHQLVLLLLT